MHPITAITIPIRFNQKKRLCLNEKKSFSFIIIHNWFGVDSPQRAQSITEEINKDSVCLIKKEKPQNTVSASCGSLLFSFSGLCFYAVVFVRDGQFLTTFSTTCSQYAATVSGCHSFTETVFVSSLSVRGLISSFHLSYLLCYYSMRSGCKSSDFFLINQTVNHF